MRLPKRTPGPPRAPKARGELAEARFIAKVLGLGYFVSKPFGDSLPYDFIVQAGGKLSRVQVKSAWGISERNAYEFGACPGAVGGRPARSYRAEEIDFLVAYAAPVDTWYVFPLAALPWKTHLRIAADESNPFEEYREAWYLLEEVSIQACSEGEVAEELSVLTIDTMESRWRQEQSSA